MNKKIFTLLTLLFMLFGSASLAHAETGATQVAGSDLAGLQAKVEMLMKQVEMLQNTLKIQSVEIQVLREEMKITRRLRLGSAGDDVKILQEMLATDSEIYPEGKITGYFGPMTDKAIRRFQEKHELESVGEVGPKTQEILNRFLKNSGAGNSGKIPPGLLKNAGSMIMLPLLAQNNSGLHGWAKIMDNEAGKAVVHLELYKEGKIHDDATTTRPAHIHAGACPTPGAVAYPLSGVVGGKSSTMLAVSTKELLAGLPLAINVHKSNEEASVYVACGDVKMPHEMKQDMKHSDNANDAEEAKRMQEKMYTMKQAQQPAVNPLPTKSIEPTNSDAYANNITVYAGKYYFYPSEIRVKVGVQSKITLYVKQGPQDFVSDELNIRTPVKNEGESTTVVFTPTTAGAYVYYSSVSDHRDRGMVGKIIVE